MLETIDSEIIGYSDAASLLGIPRGTLHAWVCKKQCPHLRLGRRLVRFNRAALLAWRDSHAVAPVAGGAK